MSKPQRVRTVIVGCGMISEVYMENLASKFTICHLVACCDSVREKAEEKAKKFGIAVMTLDEILKDESIELVVNLTPPAAHYPILKQLILAHKNVFTEKILAVGLEEARELISLADSHGVLLGSAPDTFLGSAAQTARQIIESGLIGEVTSFVASINRDYRTMAELIPFVVAPGGGIGFDLGIYYVTALLNILGPVKRCSGFMQTRRKDRMHLVTRNENFSDMYEVLSENVMVGSLELENGVLGTLHFNSESVGNERPSVVVYGTEGMVYLANPDQFGGDVSLLRKGQNEAVVVPSNHGYSENSRGLGVAEMAWAMRKGRVPRANKEMALHALEALHGIALSSQSGETYRLVSRFEKSAPLPQGYLDSRYFGSDPEAAIAL